MANLTLIRSLFVIPSFLFSTSSTINCEDYKSEASFSPENQYYISSIAAINKTSLNKHEKQFVKRYIQNNREDLYNIRRRSRSPFAMMDSIFSDYSLPLQLKYLAVIESELKPGAVSRVGAAGLWQLMPETAEILGLKITRALDERKQYHKSTRAAARYLKDLYAEFGDWLLVIAAYNCGPGPVHQAIRRSASRNFWALQSYLPAESRTHVKKFIAANYYFEGRGSETMLTAAEEPSPQSILPH